MTRKHLAYNKVPRKPNQEIKPEAFVVVTLPRDVEVINRFVRLFNVLVSNYEEVY